MNKIRLYIPPLILGFVIVPLLVWPTVVALAACVITLSFMGEILFSIPLMFRRISLLEFQLGLLAEYALFFCAMCCVGWQFSCRAQSELKSRLHCWLVFAPVYFWLLLWNIISMSRQRKLHCWKICAVSFWPLSGSHWIFRHFGLNRGLTLSVQ